MAFPSDFDDVSASSVITSLRNNAITHKLGTTTVGSPAALTGHFSMPTLAGVPTGNPANGAGSMVWDNTSNKLYINEDGTSGSWAIIGVGYEEGTWDPVLTKASLEATTDIHVGDYIIIGDIVHASFLITITGVAAPGSGNVSITGLPFSKRENDYQWVALIGYNDIFPDAVTRAYVVGSSLQIMPDGVTQSNYAGVISTGYLAMTFTYFTNS